ncbi:MAG: hypothetical protein ABFS24_15540 [Pseudomonadota bacterium]
MLPEAPVLKRITLAALLLIPVAAWVLYKPVRVLAPQLVSGVSCVTETICLDDIDRVDEAEFLFSNALGFIGSSVASIEKPPRVTFCSTEACFQAFGFNKSTARTVGVSGIVISPRGWSEYYLRHEMIHHIQAERMGVYRQWRSPDWFKEGMAYSLSQDPRTKLGVPLQEYRSRFNDWYQSIDTSRLWEHAITL